MEAMTVAALATGGSALITSGIAVGIVFWDARIREKDESPEINLRDRDELDDFENRPPLNGFGGHNNAWTEKDLRFLILHWNKPSKAVGNAIYRTENAIENMKYRLKTGSAPDRVQNKLEALELSDHLPEEVELSGGRKLD